MSYDENRISDQIDGGLHEQCTIYSVSDSIIDDINTLAHYYNHKIDTPGNTDEQNIISKAKRDALDEALLIIKKYYR